MLNKLTVDLKWSCGMTKQSMRCISGAVAACFVLGAISTAQARGLIP
jgi:hypothetical protein